jgi:hypothetical protein
VVSNFIKGRGERMKKDDNLIAGRSNKERHEDSLRRKKVFLTAYEEWGTLRKSCELAGISRHTYFTWMQKDFDFQKEMDIRKHAFAEGLEEIALERVRNPDKNRGSDVLLIGLLNANMPQKYRPQFAMSEDSAKELIIEWRKAAKDIKKDKGGEPAELPGVVENTLQEILDRRGSAPEKEEDNE